ncbi:glucosamine-6-phosphate deaminase [Gracilibacillus ureilyticus]|uniref:Glucosamine-6-phosphate deaminase n=1 Tax=Gracilibacillus ureilyticus TaxID=531814 RepID=A0A1H9NGF6_9BACI|nr:glucosamine-6-phosphate deaminase [Gracilibacillus ureilyticus]SER34951.1 glucosamine-6-phosphate deaminase [Gracilibacillus ureilyticus]
MQIIEAENYEDMSRIAGQIIAREINSKPDTALGLATGSTPLGLYTELVKLYEEKRLSFQHTITFNLDEYVGLPASDSNSYHYFMKKHFFQYIDLKEENRHIPNGMAENLQEECKKYERLIEKSGGIDLQILGIGGNGHIGFNEPGTPFSAQTHIICLDQSTREANARFFPTMEQVPAKAITVGIETIMRSKQIILLISGKTKYNAYKRLLDGEITETFPASILHKHDNCTVIVDKETVC